MEKKRRDALSIKFSHIAVSFSFGLMFLHRPFLMKDLTQNTKNVNHPHVNGLRLINTTYMAKKKSELRLLCEDYCRQYPKIKSLTLSKKIFDENKKLCVGQTVEKIRRNYVTVIRGLSGNKKRDKVSDKSLYQHPTFDTRNSPKPFKEQINTSAKVLILDIETAPIKAYVWGIWNQNVGTNQIQHDWYCLTWAAKWLFEDKVYSGKLTPHEAKKGNDKRLIKGIWELINQADIVIAHNGEKFDMPKLNSRFIINGLQPPLPYQTIDTLKHIRRQFGFTSNKLDYVNQLLGLPRKQENEGMPLWVRCVDGEQDALNEMEEYNVQDVRILEGTYLQIRAWIKPHPNMGLFILDEKECRCPSCGSDNMKEAGKKYNTTMNVYELLRCDNCGAAARKRLASIGIKQRRFLTSSTPR